ncbi:MAG: cytochrome b/b6 domain-containing protein [Deltaproteobacteria bacterium]|nr:cytochrome b/b6 domain-containing protein [Deltaproteobacteria bacterium]
MKPLIFYLFALQLLFALVSFAGEPRPPVTEPTASSTKASPRMHPAIEPLNSVRQNAFYTHTPVDANATCGNCHDSAYIQKHNIHQQNGANVNCFDCHVSDVNAWSDAELDIYGKLSSERTGIHRANNTVCSKCHGVVAPFGLAVPDDYESRVINDDGSFSYDLTRFTGVFFSGVFFSKSQLNLKNKNDLNFPADVHAQRMLRCADCHHSANNPAKAERKKSQQRHLRKDPRSMSLSSYLHRPDHRLEAPQCSNCHLPTEAHDFLPYKERHLEVLDCQACHVAKVYGPLVSAIDETVVTRDGAPVVEYAASISGGNLNAKLNPGISPALIPYLSENGKVRVGSFNLVAHWYWEDTATGKKIPNSVIRKFFLGPNGEYTAVAITLFDKDKNGKLSNSELMIGTEKQHTVILKWLTQQGYAAPRRVAVVDAYKIAHGISEMGGVVRECETCHGQDGRLSQNISITARLPFQSSIAAGARMSSLRQGSLKTDDTVRWVRDGQHNDYYVFGYTRAAWSDLLGLLLFGASFLGILFHGGYRFYSRKKRVSSHGPMKRVYMYSLYERIWHWLMASSVIVLLTTGLKIHFPMNLSFVSFPTAVTLHNITAVILVINAALSLFFHLASAAIVQFIPEKKGLLQALIAQVEYYTRGIFLGHKHPAEKTPDKKLNPLQQLTYLGLLNVLFPLQVLTGLAIWLNSKWPQLLEPLGGLSVIGPVHNLGSWMFLTFLVVHLYLTTTGHTIVSNISAMINGYDDIDAETVEGGNK